MKLLITLLSLISAQELLVSGRQHSFQPGRFQNPHYNQQNGFQAPPYNQQGGFQVPQYNQQGGSQVPLYNQQGGLPGQPIGTQSGYNQPSFQQGGFQGQQGGIQGQQGSFQGQQGGYPLVTGNQQGNIQGTPIGVSPAGIQGTPIGLQQGGFQSISQGIPGIITTGQQIPIANGRPAPGPITFPQ